MYEHVLAEVSNDNGRLIEFEPLIDSGVALICVSIIFHQSEWNVFPVAALGNMPITFEYLLVVSRHEMVRALRQVPSEPLRII
jgi:hypothetical protein